MYCPVCRAASLFAATLEPGLRTQCCRRCEGHRLQANAFWHWRERAPSPASTHSPPVTPDDTAGVKWCPDCHHVLLRYRVGLHIPFGLDHCGQCGGVWLDKDEWDALKHHGLEWDLYYIFTDAWQRRVRRMKSHTITENHFRRSLGPEGFDRVKTFKDWLERQPDRNLIFAYLRWDERRV